jgi:hypothetical protein
MTPRSRRESGRSINEVSVSSDLDKVPSESTAFGSTLCRPSWSTHFDQGVFIIYLLAQLAPVGEIEADTVGEGRRGGIQSLRDRSDLMTQTM